jgi:hypothetical protein
MRNGAPVATAFTFSEGDRTVTLSPAAPLSLNTNFTIEATPLLTDPAGNTLSSPLTASFKTKSPDVVPPRVSAIVPAHGSVNVPVGTDIRATFTEPIAPATITPDSFRVTIAGAPVSGQFGFADNNATVRFAPAAPLPFDAIVVVELTSAITDLFENALADGAGQPLSVPVTFMFVTGTFGITSPAQGSDVLENAPITIEAKAGASLNLATIAFTVNGQAVATVGAPFTTPYAVGAAATTPTLTIVATGRDASGAQVAQDQVVVTVVPGLRVSSRLLGVPLGGVSGLRLMLAAPLPTDLNVTLSVVDATIASLPGVGVVLPAGQTEVVVPVTGVSTGATTIAASSSRGDTWAIASVSAPVAKTMSSNAAPVGVVVVPARLLGRVFTSPSGQATVTVPILRNPAVVETPVAVTSTDAAVASVAGDLSIAPGSQTVTVTVMTGAAGTATLTLRAGSEFGQLTIVVGTPSPGTVPPTLARPVGVVLIPAASAGRLFTAPAGQSTLSLTLLSSPAAAATPVTVSSSHPSVATVSGAVVVAAGAQSVTVSITTGEAGTATLTFRAGAETREVTVVVGPPPPGTIPPTLARPVGIVLLAAPSAGRLFTPAGGQSVVTLQLLAAPAAAATTVSVSSSNGDVASVSGDVVIAAGATTAQVTIATGINGTATLSFRAGAEVREVTVVVGPPAPGTVPLVFARPVGVVLIPQRQLGSVFSAIGGQPSLNVMLLSSVAASPTPVSVTSSDPNVASVSDGIVIPAGASVAAINIQTGIQGVATLTLRAGSDVAQIDVIVGTPPVSRLPLILAPIVGVEQR